jgi:aminoglycoside phosphotransferase (APT) family kinase protein
MITNPDALATGATDKKAVAKYFANLPKGILGPMPISVSSVSRLNLGESNLDFLVATNQGKFVFRINMDPASATKSALEFDSLRALAGLRIAPEAFYLDESKVPFGETSLVVKYLEGKPLSELEEGKISAESAAELAHVVAVVHSIDEKKLAIQLPVRGLSYESWFARIRKDIAYVGRNRKSRSLKSGFDKSLRDSFDRLQETSVKSAPPNVSAPGHGDICAQNVIVDDDGAMRLIDWENFGLWDPAAEIAMVFEAFGLDFPVDRELEFLSAYTSLRQDQTLRERLNVFRPIVRFEQLTWGIRHVFEIANEEMNKAFVEATKMSEHLAFVDFCLIRLVKTGLIDLDLEEIPELEIFPQTIRSSGHQLSP